MITVNPVLGRELRERLRSGRAFAAITVFVGLLLLLTWAINTGSSNANPGDLSALTSTGRSLLDGLTFGMMFLMAFFLPGIAAGAISGERERETLIPLQVTLLSSRSILTGKILAASAFAALLLVAATPLFATAYLLGGVSLAEAVRTLVALGAIAVMITTIAVVCSSIVRRTQAAVLLAYTVTFFVFVAAPFIFGMASIVETRRNQPTGAPNGVTRALLLPNPVVALAAFAEPSRRRENKTARTRGRWPVCARVCETTRSVNSAPHISAFPIGCGRLDSSASVPDCSRFLVYERCEPRHGPSGSCGSDPRCRAVVAVLGAAAIACGVAGSCTAMAGTRYRRRHPRCSARRSSSAVGLAGTCSVGFPAGGAGRHGHSGNHHSNSASRRRVGRRPRLRHTRHFLDRSRRRQRCLHRPHTRSGLCPRRQPTRP